MDERKPPLHELLRKFAALRGLPVKETPKGLACRISDKTILTIFYRPVSRGHLAACAMEEDLSGKFLRTKFYDKSLADYMRNKIEESIEILELRKRIMDPEKLETAERMAKKRRKLQEVYDLLKAMPGVVVQDNPAENLYPMPLYAKDKDEVFVGRVRRDFSQPKTLNLWVVSDNLRKGAATNAVQIMEMLLKR